MGQGVMLAVLSTSVGFVCDWKTVEVSDGCRDPQPVVSEERHGLLMMAVGSS